ncbi:hypothetical protein HD554DRAFT_2040725 [Boletus coccyginus]|nr:hypothetical protein HD554DRAFT_2040725 [Boletus coccyginus]
MMEADMAARQILDSTRVGQPVRPRPRPCPVTKAPGLVLRTTESLSLDPDKGTDDQEAELQPHLVTKAPGPVFQRTTESLEGVVDSKDAEEGRIKNWNKAVVSATVKKWPSLYASLHKNQYTYPCQRTLITETPRPRWGLSRLDPPTPSKDQDYVMNGLQGTSPATWDQIAVIDDEYNNVKGVGVVEEADMFGSSAAINLKWKFRSSEGDDKHSTSNEDTSKAESKMVRGSSRGYS